MEEMKNKNNKKIEILDKIEMNENITFFKVKNKENNKIYSIKKIALKNESEEELEEIKNEIKILININSEYTIKYINSFIKNNYFHIVNEYSEDLSLRKLIEEFKNANKLISQNLIYHIIKEICQGLKELYNNNIKHIDLNPDNIFLTNNKRIKIGCFGILKLLNNYNDYIFENNNYYNYMAPEIIKGEKANNKVDIWSLGCIIYELCKLDYCFNCSNVISLHNKIINEIHDKINLKFYECELQKLIDMLLKKNQKERPNIDDVYKLVIKYCDSGEEKKFVGREEKNKIKIVLEIKESDINKDIYFLDNTDYEDENGNKHFHDSLKELNESNVKLYIKNKKYRYQKCFRFAETGEYNIKLKFYFSLKDCSNMFYNCNCIKSINLSKLHTKNVTNMSHMFYNCDNLSNINLSNFNTENVINMSNIFSRCYNLENIDLSSFNTKNVINMNNMFHSCDKLINLDLSSFDTKNVIDMSYLFSYCNSLKSIDLSSFNTENVKNMGGMFYMCENLTNLNLSSFNTQNVENINEMFCHCENLQQINLLSFNTINVKTMEKLFYNCNNLIEINLSSFKTENVENISRMFFGCKNLEIVDLSNFSFQKVNNFFQAFFNCNKLKKIIINKNIDISILQKEFKENNIEPGIIY